MITDAFKRRRKRRIIVYGSVTRYGPRNQRKELTFDTFKERVTHHREFINYERALTLNDRDP